MKNRLILTILFALVTLISGQGDGMAGPGNIAGHEMLRIGAVSSPAIKIDYDLGCGWEYPCPPRPWFGRRTYRPARHGQVVIHNNYGVVNVYVNGQRHHHERPKYRTRCTWGGCGAPRYRRAAEPEACETDSCRKCGLGCWYRRMKRGYCGHGCDWYREASRFERAERTSYKRHRYYDEEPSSEFQKPDFKDDESQAQTWHRRRYEGPPYPP